MQMLHNIWLGMESCSAELLSYQTCAILVCGCPNVAVVGAIRAGACPRACHSRSAGAGEPLAPHLSPALFILTLTCSWAVNIRERQQRRAFQGNKSPGAKSPCPLFYKQILQSSAGGTVVCGFVSRYERIITGPFSGGVCVLDLDGCQVFGLGATLCMPGL
jgi:hypothetical protein